MTISTLPPLHLPDTRRINLYKEKHLGLISPFANESTAAFLSHTYKTGTSEATALSFLEFFKRPGINNYLFLIDSAFKSSSFPYLDININEIAPSRHYLRTTEPHIYGQVAHLEATLSCGTEICFIPPLDAVTRIFERHGPQLTWQASAGPPYHHFMSGKAWQQWEQYKAEVKLSFLIPFFLKFTKLLF
jgi:hypothetical protein